MISGLSRVEGVKGFLMRKALEGTKPGKKTNKQNNQSPPRDSEGCERNDASSSKEASKEALERPGLVGWLVTTDAYWRPSASRLGATTTSGRAM